MDETEDKIVEFIKKNLRVVCEEIAYYGEPASIVVKLVLKDEVISESYFDFPVNTD